jgi:hypothetical protein
MALLEYVFLERLCEECEEIARLQFILTNVARDQRSGSVPRRTPLQIGRTRNALPASVAQTAAGV